MTYLFSAFGLAVAVAGSDKLGGDRAYSGLFSQLGWSHRGMRRLAMAEVIGGLMIAWRPTRRIGGGVVSTLSAAVLASELRHGDAGLAASRAMVLAGGLAALIAPGRKSA